MKNLAFEDQINFILENITENSKNVCTFLNNLVHINFFLPKQDNAVISTL